jgi:hypothetical protein
MMSGRTHHWEDYWFGNRDLIQHGEIKDEQGSPVTESNFDNNDIANVKEDLPKGWTANIYAGKGETNSKHIAEPFQVEYGYDDRPSGWGDRDGYAKRWYHRRYEAIPDPSGGTETIEHPPKKMTESYVSPGTLVHEVGHSMDPHIDPSLRHLKTVDPVIEAVADGFADRHQRYGNLSEAELQPSAERLEKMQKTGYSTEHSVMNQNRSIKALYLAVRTHTALHGDSPRDAMPSRDEFSQNVYNNPGGPEPDHNDKGIPVHANTMLLGYLHNKHSHVRNILGLAGLSDVGQKAEEYWKSRTLDAAKPPTPEQPTLF